MRPLQKAGAVFDHIIDSLAGMAGVLVIAMMFIMSYESIMRYFFHAALGWAVEVSEYIVFLLAFLGAAWLLKLGRHVRVDLVLTLLKPKARVLLNVATSAMGVIICLAIAWFGVASTIDHFQRGIPVVKTLAFPKFTLLLFIPLGSFMLSIQFLRQTYGHVKSWRAIAREEQEIAKEELKIWE